MNLSYYNKDKKKTFEKKIYFVKLEKIITKKKIKILNYQQIFI